MEFIDSLDIANRACDHVGVPHILTPTEISPRNKRIASVYGKLRQAELRRNVWTFSTRRTILRAINTTTLILTPALWSATVTYLPGSIVLDANGEMWTSLLPDNLNHEPGSTTVWNKYFGPMTADLYDSTTSYFAGELVYKLVGNPGGYVVFVSLESSNSDDPSTATAWSATATYNIDDTVTYLGVQYKSMIELNKAITPANGSLEFDINATYAAAQQATGSDGYIYTSIAGSNVGHDPVTDNGVHWTNTTVPNAWTSLPALYPSSRKWLPIFASLTSFQIIYPIGTGPSTQAATKNLFRLPAGYLRKAPQDPKAGSVSFLGAPSGLMYNDWEFDGQYIVSREVYPIPFRFVADVSDVTLMDPMFCEGLGARIALEVCEPLTQSNAKIQTISATYKVFMTEARQVNAVEQGTEEPPEDDYITCRL